MPSLRRLPALRLAPLLALTLASSSFAIPGSRPLEASPTLGERTGTSPAGGPPYFEENLGQAGPGGGFLWRGGGSPALIAGDGALLAGGVRLRFRGAVPGARVVGTRSLPGRSSYFRGNDPSGWVSGARHFARLRARGVYPGIDVVWRADRRGRLEHDFVIAPGADPSRVRVTFEGATPSLGKEGDLVLATPRGRLRQHPPVAFQSVRGIQVPVTARYLVSARGVVRLHLGRFDPALPLIVDPVLEYSTYQGGGLADWGTSVDVTSDGQAVATGYTQSMDFRNQDGGFGERSITDVFVTKLAADGSLIYAVYLGGDEPPFLGGVELGCDSPVYATILIRGCGEEYGFAVALDEAGNAVVTGFTNSRAFPVVQAAQPSFAGGDSDAFASKINASGTSLLWSTYLGGSGAEESHAVATDGSGRTLLGGATSSADFPTSGALQGSLSGATDGFVTYLTEAGAIERSTYLGGGGAELVEGIAADEAGGAILTGRTGSEDFPTRDPIHPSFSGGEADHFGLCPCDAFVAKIAPGGSALEYSTFLGGSGNDYGRDVEVDENGRAHVVGETVSVDFPTAEPIQPQSAGPADGFLAFLSEDGQELEFSTYFGGEYPEDAGGIALDRCGNVYMAGYTISPNFPTHRSMQGPNPGSTKLQNDAYLVKIDADRRVVYSTLVGGETYDGAYSVAVDDAGTAYIAGFTGSGNFPTHRAVQPGYAGGGDAIMARISDELCDPEEPGTD